MMKVAICCAAVFAAVGGLSLSAGSATGNTVSDLEAAAVVGGACSDFGQQTCNGTAAGCEATTCLCAGSTTDDQEPSDANVCGDSDCGVVKTTKDCNS
jgi:hypothetical protein